MRIQCSKGEMSLIIHASLESKEEKDRKGNKSRSEQEDEKVK